MLVPADQLANNSTIGKKVNEDLMLKMVNIEHARRKVQNNASTRRGSVDSVVSQILAFPKSIRGKALSLFNKLKRLPFIDWDDDTESINLYGEHLQGSSILDLIRYATHRKGKKPNYWSEFQNLMEHAPQKGGRKLHKRL